MGYLSYTHDHYDKHWQLDYITNIKLEQARFRLLLIVEDCRTEMVRSLMNGQLGKLEQFYCESDVWGGL